MCGIAGYSLSPESRVDQTLAAQALLAGIAERGADAVGYAYRGAGESSVAVHKQQSGASALLEQISVPASVTQALVHVRDYTKGHPTIAANNHPVRHGAVARRRFATHPYVEDDPLPAVRAPHEAVAAMQALAALFAAA